MESMCASVDKDGWNLVCEALSPGTEQETVRFVYIEKHKKKNTIRVFRFFFKKSTASVLSYLIVRYVLKVLESFLVRKRKAKTTMLMTKLCPSAYIA